MTITIEDFENCEDAQSLFDKGKEACKELDALRAQVAGLEQQRDFLRVELKEAREKINELNLKIEDMDYARQEEE